MVSESFVSPVPNQLSIPFKSMWRYSVGHFMVPVEVDKKPMTLLGRALIWPGVVVAPPFPRGDISHEDYLY
jgi:hypothetical protein